MVPSSAGSVGSAYSDTGESHVRSEGLFKSNDLENRRRAS